MTWMLWFVLTVTTWGFLDIIYHSIRFGVGPLPSSMRAIRLACQEIQEDQNMIYDVGGGFGIATKYFAKRFPTKNIQMIEVSYFSCLVAKIYCMNISNVTIVHGNFLNHSFPKRSFLYMYLYPSLMEKLAEQLHNWEGKVVSYVFSFRNLQEKKRISISQHHGEQLFVYEFKKSM